MAVTECDRPLVGPPLRPPINPDPTPPPAPPPPPPPPPPGFRNCTPGQPAKSSPRSFSPTPELGHAELSHPLPPPPPSHPSPAPLLQPHGSFNPAIRQKYTSHMKAASFLTLSRHRDSSLMEKKKLNTLLLCITAQGLNAREQLRPHPELRADGGLPPGRAHLQRLISVSAADALKEVVDEVEPAGRERE